MLGFRFLDEWTSDFCAADLEADRYVSCWDRITGTAAAAA
jgi:hypothetical protein